MRRVDRHSYSSACILYFSRQTDTLQLVHLSQLVRVSCFQHFKSTHDGSADHTTCYIRNSHSSEAFFELSKNVRDRLTGNGLVGKAPDSAKFLAFISL